MYHPDCFSTSMFHSIKLIPRRVILNGDTKSRPSSPLRLSILLCILGQLVIINKVRYCYSSGCVFYVRQSLWQIWDSLNFTSVMATSAWCITGCQLRTSNCLDINNLYPVWKALFLYPVFCPLSFCNFILLVCLPGFKFGFSLHTDSGFSVFSRKYLSFPHSWIMLAFNSH